MVDIKSNSTIDTFSFLFFFCRYQSVDVEWNVEDSFSYFAKENLVGVK